MKSKAYATYVQHLSCGMGVEAIKKYQKYCIGKRLYYLTTEVYPLTKNIVETKEASMKKQKDFLVLHQ